MVGDGAAGLWSAGRARNIIGRRGVVKDRGWTKEGGRRLSAGEGVIQVGLMGVGVGDSRAGAICRCCENRSA